VPLVQQSVIPVHVQGRLFELLLHSLKTIREGGGQVTTRLRRSTPDPRFGTSVELSSGDTSSLLNLIRVGKTLSSQSIASEAAPPALLQVEPARSSGNEDLVEPRMLGQPSTSLGAVVTGEVVGDDVNVALGLSTSMSWSKAMYPFELREAPQRVSSLLSRTRKAP